MNKLTRFLLLLLVPGVTSLFLISCEDYEDKLTGTNPEGNAVDVSNRVSGFDSEVTGAGSELTVMGSNLSDVIRVRMGELWVDDFEVTESGVTFTVPANIVLGMNEVTLVFSGNGRATASIEVIPVPTISYFTPKAVGDGEEITLLGNNLDYVNTLSIGEASATITEQENDRITFTAPSGFATGLINIESTSGNLVTSTDSVVACTSNPGHLACLPVINTNGSFEDASLGEASGVAGWGGLTGSLATGVITDEERYDGFQSVKITVNDLGSNPWNIQPTSAMTVDPTATYHVSFWVKGTGLANVKFAFDEAGTPGYMEWQAPEVSLTSGEWMEITYTVSPESEAGPTGDQNARFAISMSYDGNIGGVMYLDNFRVVEVE